MNDPIADESAIPGDMMYQCRCCLWKLKKNLMSQDIFQLWAEEEYSDTCIATEMAKIANVEIADLEGYPRHICFKCLDRLKSAIPLVNDIRQTQEELRNRLSSVEDSTGQTWPKPIEIERNLSEDILRNSTDVEIKQEVISDDECKDEDVEMEDALATDSLDEPEIKLEPEEMVEQPAIQVTVNDSSYDDGGVDLLDVIEAKTSKRNISHLDESIRQNFTFSDFVINKKIFKSLSNLGPKCKCKSFRDCAQLSQVQRQFIFDYFWGPEITKQQQYNFFINFTERISPQQNTSYGLKSSLNTYYYFLPIDKTLSKKIKVCKTMFVNTIGANSECTKRIWNLYDRLQMFKNNKYMNLKITRKTKRKDTKKNYKSQRLFDINFKSAPSLKKTNAVLTDRIKSNLTNVFDYTSKPIDTEFSRISDELKNTIKQAHVVLSRIDDAFLDQDTCKNSNSKDQAPKKEDEAVTYLNLGSQEDLEDADDFDSKCSSFNEEFRELPDQENDTKASSQENVANDRLHLVGNINKEISSYTIHKDKSIDENVFCSDEDTSTDNSIIFQSKQEKRAKRITKKQTDPSFVVNKKQLKMNINERESIQNEIENMAELLTDRLKRPTKDREIIMNYRRNRGLSYIKKNGDVIPKKILGLPCNCKKMKCESRISQEQRQNIFDYFWSLGDRKKQKNFVLKFSARVKATLAETKRNGFSIKYYLPITRQFDESVEKVRVCKKMFVNTIATRQSYTKNIWHKVPVFKFENQSSKKTSSKVQIQDNTLIDFVYRAMPFDEFMSHFSSKKDQNICDVDSEAETSDKTARKPSFKKRLKMVARRRLNGKRYMTPKGKIVGEKVIGPPCHCAARKCTDKILQQQREYVFQYYWGLEDIAKKRAFLVRFTAREGIRRRKTDTINSRREYTFKHYLPLTQDFDGEKTQVCVKMFDSTLAIQSGIIKTAWEKYARGCLETEDVSKNYFSKIDKSTANSAIDHFNYIKEIDPELTKFIKKTKSRNFILYTKIYKLYDSWFDPSKYTGKVSNARNYRRIVEGDYQKYLEKYSDDRFN